MPENHQVLSVFLCHASGDKSAVRDLYRRLQSDGIRPWLDEVDLLPGQDWQREIFQAVRGADAVVICLSKTSVSKTGYVQKEIKYALDAAFEQPEGAIFIIPLRLEPCDVPNHLRQWHWVDLFDEGGYELLVRGLRTRAVSIGRTIPLAPSRHTSKDREQQGEEAAHSFNKVKDCKKRTLHVIWICDVSGSMAGTKIAALNGSLRRSAFLMRGVASDFPEADVFVRAIKFSTGATWHIPPTAVAKFEWVDLYADGLVDLGAALVAVAGQLMLLPADESIFAPILVLISDGQPTDDFKKGLSILMRDHWGKKSLRLAIGQGQYAPLEVLQQFIGRHDFAPLRANNSDQLQMFINWISTSVLESVLGGAERMLSFVSWDDTSGDTAVTNDGQDDGRLTLTDATIGICDFLAGSLLGEPRRLDNAYSGVSEKELRSALAAYYRFRVSDSDTRVTGDLSVYADLLESDVTTLATQCALYLEQLHVPDPIFKIAVPVGSTTRNLTDRLGIRADIDRQGLADAVLEVLGLREAMEVGFIVLRASERTLEELPVIDSTDNHYDLLPRELLDFYRERSEVRRVVVDSSGRSLVMSDAEPSSLINVGFEGHPVQAFGFTLEEGRVVDGEVVDISPRRSPPTRSRYQHWSDGCVNRAAWMLHSRFAEEMSSASEGGLRYFSDSCLFRSLFTKPTSVDIGGTIISALADSKVPFFAGLDLHTVLRVRSQDGEAFESFRRVLEKALRDLRLVDDADERRKKADNAFHEIAEVNVREVHRAARNAKKQLGLSAALGFGAISMTAGIVPLEAAILGGALIVARFFGKLDQAESQLRGMPGFFLWKVDKGGRKR